MHNKHVVDIRMEANVSSHAGLPWQSIFVSVWHTGTSPAAGGSINACTHLASKYLIGEMVVVNN